MFHVNAVSKQLRKNCSNPFHFICNRNNFSPKARMSAECFRRITEGKCRLCSSEEETKGYSHLLVTNDICQVNFGRKFQFSCFFFKKKFQLSY
jgi:hypothetical protein